jgi:hypothetical protein
MKDKDEEDDDTMLPEYDFSNAVRGKYYQRYQQGTNIVVLEPDVAAAFPDSDAVNEALRALLKIAERTHVIGQAKRAVRQPG